MSTTEDDRMVVALRRAARDITGHRGIRDMDVTLGRIVASAVDTIPGVDAGSISMTRRGRVETHQPTSERLRELDEYQAEIDEGPCITAIEDPPADGLVVAQDLSGADADRWPRFAARAVGTGFRGLVSSQLSLDGGVRAALNLYSAVPYAFDDQARTLAALFGVQAALLLHGTDTAVHLQRAVDSRDLIGQAKGILMERFGVGHDAAFTMLVTSSQDTNMKLTAVAQWLTAGAGSSGSSGSESAGA